MTFHDRLGLRGNPQGSQSGLTTGPASQPADSRAGNANSGAQAPTHETSGAPSPIPEAPSASPATPVRVSCPRASISGTYRRTPSSGLEAWARHLHRGREELTPGWEGPQDHNPSPGPSAQSGPRAVHQQAQASVGAPLVASPHLRPGVMDSSVHLGPGPAGLQAVRTPEQAMPLQAPASPRLEPPWQGRCQLRQRLQCIQGRGCRGASRHQRALRAAAGLQLRAHSSASSAAFAARASSAWPIGGLQSHTPQGGPTLGPAGVLGTTHAAATAAAQQEGIPIQSATGPAGTWRCNSCICWAAQHQHSQWYRFQRGLVLALVSPVGLELPWGWGRGRVARRRGLRSPAGVHAQGPQEPSRELVEGMQGRGRRASRGGRRAAGSGLPGRRPQHGRLRRACSRRRQAGRLLQQVAAAGDALHV